jgi:hypothetical protein
MPVAEECVALGIPVLALFPVIALAMRSIQPAIVGALSDRWQADPFALLYINVGSMLICLPLTIIGLRLIAKRYTALAERVQEASKASPPPIQS